MLCQPNLLELLKNHHGVAKICLCCPLKCLQSEHTYWEECTCPSQSLAAVATAHAQKTCPSIDQKIDQMIDHQLNHQQIIDYFLSLFLSHFAFHTDPLQEEKLCAIVAIDMVMFSITVLKTTRVEIHRRNHQRKFRK